MATATLSSCIIEGCSKPSRARKMCNAHYYLWRVNGDAHTKHQPWAKAKNIGGCSVEGCLNGGRLKRGWCGKHYQRWKSHGDPSVTLTNKINGAVEDRLWPKITRTDANDCWLWTASRNDDGYGVFRFDGKMTVAHRVVYFLHYGTDPGNFEVCHKCDNPPCCNPFHLFLGTHQDNMTDMVNKGRSVHRTGAANPNYRGREKHA